MYWAHVQVHTCLIEVFKIAFWKSKQGILFEDLLMGRYHRRGDCFVTNVAKEF